MTGYLLPGEYIIGVDTALIAWIAAVALALIRTREKVARLEEWVRQHERRYNGKVQE